MSFQHSTVAVACSVYHISLSVCQAQPHSSPASSACLTHQCSWTMPTIELSMGVLNWQLESFNGVAGSHGYSIINCIRTGHLHEWKCISSKFGMETWSDSVSYSPHLSWKVPSQLQMFSSWLIIPLPFPLLLREWYLPWEVIISMIWINELAF